MKALQHRARFQVSLVLLALGGFAPAQQAYLKASNTEVGDYFGLTASISGDTVAVGAFAEDSGATGVDGNPWDNGAFDAGAVFVFARTGTTWSHQAYLKASNTGASDGFGWSVSLSGDTLVVGAPGESSGSSGVDGNQNDESVSRSGAAYVFVRTGSTWSQQAYLKSSNPGVDDNFGVAVSISGDTLVVGAHQEDSNATGVGGSQADNSAPNSGAAYVFVRNGTTWTQQAYLKASNTDAGDFFGSSVSISGDSLIVGAGAEDSGAPGIDGDQSSNAAVDSGAAYVFVRTGNTWAQQSYLKASNPGAEDRFGGAVSISGEASVVGAAGEDSAALGVGGDQSSNGAPNSGATYVYTRTGTIWTQQAYLKASNTGSSDGFGQSVSLSGQNVVVGATLEDSAAVGVDGDQGNNAASNAGAAYVFTRNALSWGQTAYLKASNTDSQDNFGRSVCVSGSSIVVGALYEDSITTGVDGDQANNGGFDSGAAYVFGVPVPPSSAFCFGDGSGTACPCANNGVVGNGCASSVNANGANLTVSGSASIAADTFALIGSGMPNSFALYVQGSTRVASGAGTAFGDGKRCAGGAVIRLGTKLNSGGASQYPIGANTPISIRGANSAGDTRTYQVWYRNAASFCTPDTFNWTNGYETTWTP